MCIISYEKVLDKYKESIIPILKYFESDPDIITEIEFQNKNIDTIKWHSKTTIDL